MSDELNIDVDMEMYIKYEDYRYNAVAEGASPMRYSAWAESPIAQDYKMRLEAKQRATAPTAAAQGEGESWGVNPTERELVAYGDGYASGLMDGPEYAPLKNEIIALQAALQQAQRERDAAVDAASVWKQAAKTHRKFGEQMAQRVEDAEQGWHDEVTSKYD